MRVAVVGTGSVGRRHLANLVARGDCDIVAVSELHRHPEVHLDGVVVPAFPDLDTAARAGLDAAVVANPTAQHLDTALRALEHGLHVLVEKPVHTTAAGVEGLARLATSRDRVVAVVQQLRVHPLLRALRERLATGTFGPLVAVEAVQGEHLADYHPGEDYRLGYASRRDLGGGVLLTQVHLVDALVWMLGVPRTIRALGGHRSSLEIDVEDAVSFLWDTADGAPVYGHVDYLARPPRLAVSVVGAGGRAELDYYASTLVTHDAAAPGAPVVTSAPFDRNALFVEVLDDFLRAVEHGTAPACPVEDALTTLQVVDAIRASYERGVVSEPGRQP